MNILGQDVDVFKYDFADTHETMFFTRFKGGRTYEKLTIEIYKSGQGLDIDRIVYDPNAMIDGSVDKFYPLGYDSKIAYKGKLPKLFQKAFIYLTFDKRGNKFREFFGI